MDFGKLVFMSLLRNVKFDTVLWYARKNASKMSFTLVGWTIACSVEGRKEPLWMMVATF